VAGLTMPSALDNMSISQAHAMQTTLVTAPAVFLIAEAALLIEDTAERLFDAPNLVRF
jgi:hypothetical protein